MAAKVTIPALLQMKREGQKSVGVVAWDYQMAQIADRAGVDIVSVGDSVGVNLWGHRSQLVALETLRVRLAQNDLAERFIVATARVFGLTPVIADRRLTGTREVSVLRAQ